MVSFPDPVATPVFGTRFKQGVPCCHQGQCSQVRLTGPPSWPYMGRSRGPRESQPPSKCLSPLCGLSKHRSARKTCRVPTARHLWHRPLPPSKQAAGASGSQPLEWLRVEIIPRFKWKHPGLGWGPPGFGPRGERAHSASCRPLTTGGAAEPVLC